MSNEPDHAIERLVEMADLSFLEEKADELTDILVEALNEAFRILHEDQRSATVH
ncbi:hypothetical protein HFC70_10670 [Agrobacterium sp. a22-2]|uniref:hypothetical protein n=1 Tax=Agrobacterium sp. a22-2 TaxID=2283840 RepID=UPI001444E1AA|nr:hypothetical protein [Agrobacterium sp. a22-2]NKN36816.1 hypothetical protein [Agrobacterium sp. a22-2]